MGQGSGVATSCGIICRGSSNLARLWQAAIAPIQSLAWELPYAACAVLKKAKKAKKKKKKKKKKSCKRKRKQKNLKKGKEIE